MEDQLKQQIDLSKATPMKCESCEGAGHINIEMQF